MPGGVIKLLKQSPFEGFATRLSGVWEKESQEIEGGGRGKWERACVLCVVVQLKGFPLVGLPQVNFKSYYSLLYGSLVKWTLAVLNMCDTTYTVELLGVVVSANGKADAHITTRAHHCRNSFHRLREASLSHPGLSHGFKGATCGQLSVSRH